MSDTQSSNILSRSALNMWVFVPSVIVAGLIGIGFVWFTNGMIDYTAVLQGWVIKYTGWLYLMFGAGILFYTLWLALGRYGNVKLGDADEKPEFGTLHWIAMMFTAGIGAGLVTWAFGEPINYLMAPPLGIEAGTSAAYEWAHMYPLIHWGFVPWAFYAIASIPIAYSLYVRKNPKLLISESCDAALPSAGKPVVKNIIDVLIILGIIAGTTTSLGIGVPLLTALISELTGLADNTTLKIFVLAGWVLLFGTSTILGLKKGIQKLADINMVLAGLLMFLILVVGPTVFILNMTTNSLGLMADNFLRIIFWSDPIDQTGFVGGWTVFYWAWWLAFAAFVGLFIARISRGRTIKQVLLGTLIWGCLGTMSYLSIAGGYALHLERLHQLGEGGLPLVQTLTDNGSNGLYLITADIAGNMPAGKITLALFIVVCVIFYATTMDSAAYIAASVSSKEINPESDPPLISRFTWIAILFLMTLGAVLTGSLDTVMAITVIGSLPLLPILILMCVSLTRQLKQDFGDGL